MTTIHLRPWADGDFPLLERLLGDPAMTAHLGGRPNQIVRSGKTVKRPAGPWSPSVHALLNHLSQVGFNGAPRPFGFDEAGNEILSYIEGEVSNYPLSESAASTEALITAAQLLRAYHDATQSFIKDTLQTHSWMLPPREPIEVICHGDYDIIYLNQNRTHIETGLESHND